MAKYAEGTTVSAINSRLEIEKLILKYAGQRAEFAYMQREASADVVFAAHGRRVRFTLPIPTMEEAKKGAMLKRDWRQVESVERRAAWVEILTMRAGRSAPFHANPPTRPATNPPSRSQECAHHEHVSAAGRCGEEF